MVWLCTLLMLIVVGCLLLLLGLVFRCDLRWLMLILLLRLILFDLMLRLCLVYFNSVVI